MIQRYFITSTGTGIGKSFITAALVQQAKQLGKSVMAYKPVISGFDPNKLAKSDTGLLIESLGLPSTAENIERISRWRFAQPLAPSMAAHGENKRISFHALIEHCQRMTHSIEDVVLIEGVGGVMVPLNDRRTVLDWIEALGIPTLLVTGTYLGSISHTLTALSALRQRHIPIHTIIVNESEEASVSLDMTVDELKHWSESQIVPLRRHADKNWRNVPELQNLLQSS